MSETDFRHDRHAVDKRPTLAAVAALAGVSVSTASLAFSGSGPVSPQTRDRVLAAAEELQYAGPDPRARSLRQGRSGIIAVVLEETVLQAFRDPVKIAFLDGIAQEIAGSGRALLLVPDVSDELSGGPSALETATMDAVVLLGCSPFVARSITITRRRSIPIVALGSTPFPDVLAVTLDDRPATVTLARHLQSLGHREVAVVALPLESSRERGPLTAEWESRATISTTIDRLAGAREVFPELAAVITAGSLVDEGLLAGRSLLSRAANERPTAIIAQSDLLAAGVIRAAQELGLQVPGDVSVVGFDGIRLDNVISHDLTTMVQPAAEQGGTAGRMVLEMLDGGHPAAARFTSAFHLGDTTAPPAP
ncbi:DNA-binding LacI/PurR family transcriptional regulator [Nakamurella sp. UYEF19]|uniref:LacI family DNA-binding transcriptional regulator n=1 Tax=Nakamurella sp. UYEF19 TaxID=1756392 RepID=UPI0033910E29